MSTRKRPRADDELAPDDDDLLGGDGDALEAGDDTLEGAGPEDGPPADPEAQLNELQKGFRERHRQDQQRFQDATDTEYWFCVCFQSREQKEAYLKAKKWLDLGDKYLDGTELAEREGIRLPVGTARFLTEKPDRKLSDLSRPLP